MKQKPHALRPADPKIEAFVAAKISSGELKPRTAHNYGADVERLGRFLQEGADPPFPALYDATEDDLRLFLSELRANNSINSLKRKKAALVAFYAYLIKVGYRSDHPADNIELPKSSRRSRELFALSRDEVRRLLEAPMDQSLREKKRKRGDFRARDRALLYFFYSGPKRHEMITTKASDFDAKTQSIRVRGRQVPLSKEAADAISAYLEVRPESKSKALFLTISKQTMTMRQAWVIVKGYIRACGLRADTDIETLRRSFAVHALENGVYVLDVLAALGNVSISALHEYAKLAREGFARRQKSADTARAEIPFSRFLQCIHDIRVAATNLLLESTKGKSTEETARVVEVQMEKLRSDWPSLVDEEAFVTLQTHAKSRSIADYKEIVAEDLSALESRALSLFSENQERRQQAGFIALLHPRVIQSSLRHFLDKDYRDAVLNAMLALTEVIREKSGLDGDGISLASRVFKPENPVLAVSPLQTQSERDEQAGFHKMLMGAYEGIRNPSSHDFFRSLTETEAAQSLALISYLTAGVEAAMLTSRQTVPAQ